MEPAREDDQDKARRGRRNLEEAGLYCPRCSSRLSEMKCKLLCARCGYYMSCADYY